MWNAELCVYAQGLRRPHLQEPHAHPAYTVLHQPQMSHVFVDPL